MSKDEDYELWLAMNEDFGVPAEALEPEKVAEVPVEFEPILEQSVDQEVAELEEPASSTLEFELSPSLIREPQTNSIIVQPIDPLATGSIITDAGEIVLTGSIELPVLPTTGGIAIVSIPEVNAADDSIAEDFAENYVSSIAPVRASGVMNSRARESVLPIKNRRGESQAVLLGMTSVLMVTVGALLIAAFWLGVLKF
ncbi:MAG: hypothetical protein ORN27_07415 [Rhodoluna sp.]|nr:hypothetical protein [Rhodoluna sp.]